MPRHLDPTDLPDRVRLYAQAEVATGRYASVEDVLAAGIDALQELRARAEAEGDWLAYARRETADGFAELDRGEGIACTAGEHMVRIDAAVRARIAERPAK
jgi:Arc/MetJ-type ribon-helix-helix transcriptional regulator